MLIANHLSHNTSNIRRENYEQFLVGNNEHSQKLFLRHKSLKIAIEDEIVRELLFGISLHDSLFKEMYS